MIGPFHGVEPTRKQFETQKNDKKPNQRKKQKIKNINRDYTKSITINSKLKKAKVAKLVRICINHSFGKIKSVLKIFSP